ncbi:carbohydrate binding domain-containing protein [Hymenobacter sp.]|jgi:hypothetical protein|uniref:carbohydrate binding domain-containing protein n=1 Tax=Hymenobacter sp. TaxID=1898978 RepID=UPI002ED77B32
MKRALFAFFALYLTACGDKAADKPANQLTHTDFESIDGWLGDNTSNSLTKEKAHSGQYSIKVDPAIEYSIGYNNLLGKLSASKLRKIKVSAWVYLPKGSSDAVLVTQVVDPANATKPILWDGLRLADQVKTNDKWVNVEKEIALPDNVSYANRFNIYLWRTSSPGTAFIDDLSVEKVD